MLSQQEIIALAVESGLAEVTDTADSLPVEYVEALARFAALVSAKETKARQAAQHDLEQYRNEAQRRAGVLIKEAYQRGRHDEREACAKVCDLEANEARMVRKVEGDLVGLFLGHRVSALDAAAAAIRARSAE